jgi:hypothetical protein
MRLTYEQAKELGLKDHWPTRVKVPDPPQSEPLLNKLEAGFLELLRRGPFLSIEAQSIKLRLGGRTWYTPDFVATEDVSGKIWAFEVKGFMRDDAAVKLKVAASMYPWMTWVLVTKGQLGWRCCFVTKSGGMSREIWSPDW